MGLRLSLDTIDEQALASLSDQDLAELVGKVTDLTAADRRENQLLYYVPASDDCYKIHRSKAAYLGVGGGNGSSKTESNLVDMIACATGVIPHAVPEIKERFRGPINCRVVVESLTTTLENVIIPKLQWWKWTGVGQAGSDKGHWGWIPKLCLKDASWDQSYSVKFRTLTLLCRDPDNFNRVLGESTFQFMSHEQDASDFASGDFHDILHDEPTRYAIWVENCARAMRVNGRVRLAMTWPDDPAIPVDWIFDEIYEPGSPGPMKRDTHEWIELDTRKNRNLNQESVARQAENWSGAIKQTRLGGKPIRFSNRIHPLFVDHEQYWSFEAAKTVIPIVEPDGSLRCPETGSFDVVEFNHVQDIAPSRLYPTIFLIDPHPRKPHMWMWVQVDPADDYLVILADELDGTPEQVWQHVRETEESWHLSIAQRLMDPNMGASPSRGNDRDLTWQREFSDVGLMCDLADDSDVGRGRINEYLQPDRDTQRPRMLFDPRCQMPIFQMKRYCWDDHKRSLEKDLKQQPKRKNDDFPTLLKYMMNALPTYRNLRDGPQIIRLNGPRGRR